MKKLFIQIFIISTIISTFLDTQCFTEASTKNKLKTNKNSNKKYVKNKGSSGNKSKASPSPALAQNAGEQDVMQSIFNRRKWSNDDVGKENVPRQSKIVLK